MPNKPHWQHHSLNMTFKHLLPSDSILNTYIHKIMASTPLRYIILTHKHIKLMCFLKILENYKSYVLI